ncbi:hypothetical protein AMAG_04040 [Allomyces macrogynus ATCC 38327]|uniref:Uncharacterized protein n=1 Tax=Allomyces macrogynus (strain ATCC 38327) TaxID=578462 RepID=A0A0L0S811_ALLM3|nr:hypothetical protein AMAG_04040 [Allomyces macrogynus ATCC 38327]|eukprot:KNE58469.1 hypothetical protein AMAG_04040 [Allomyces macrogynus ATCC 38327]
MSASSSTFTESRPKSFLPDVTGNFQLEPLFPPICTPGASDVAVHDCDPDAKLTTKGLVVESALVGSKPEDEPTVANDEEEVDLTRENASLHDLPLDAAPDGGLSAILVVDLPNAEFKGRATAAEVSLVGSVSFGDANLLRVYSGRLADV